MSQSKGFCLAGIRLKIVLGVIPLLSLWFTAQLGWAADDSSEVDHYTIAGHLIFTRSPISARDLYGDYRKLRARSNIFVADTLKLNVDNHGQFRLRDGAIFEVSGRSEFTISDFSPHQGKDLARSVLYLHEGHVQFFVGLETQVSPSLRIIKTPVGWLETKNAMFSVSLTDDGLMKVNVSSGQVTVSNPNGTLTIGDKQPFREAHVTSLSTRPQGYHYASSR